MVAVRLGLVFLTLTFVGLNTWAQPVIQTFNSSTFSRLTGPLVGDTIDVNNTVYGGLSGNCVAAGNTTCNSCETASPGQACNTRRIYDSLRLTISFRAHKQGFLLVTNNVSQDSGALFNRLTVEGPFQSGSGGLPAPEGTLIEVQIPWSEICQKIFQSSGGCDSIDEFGSKIIRVGLSEDGNSLNEGDFISNLLVEIHKIDDDNGSTVLCDKNASTAQGLCNFSVFPGDGKAFIDDIRGSCNLPNLPKSGRARQARIFYKEVSEDPDERDFPNITSPKSEDLRILSKTGGGTTCTIPLSESSIGGLQNGTLYSFAIGLVDQAGNVGYVTDMMSSGASQDTADKAACFDPTDPSLSRNCHLVRPDEVTALFQDEFDCFITTAAYGSPTQYQVKTFREFRNHYLKTNWLGQKIINFYYRTSPPIASWIRQHPQSKFWVRMTLWPLWLFAEAALAYPFSVVLILGLMTLPLFKPWRLRS